MSLPPTCFEPETVALMGRICDEASRDRGRIVAMGPADSAEARRLTAERVLAAVAAGERDPQRLKAIALDEVDG